MAQKTADGTYRVRVRLPNGRRVSKNFPTKAMAEQFEAKLKLGRVDPELTGGSDRGKVRFADFAQRYLDEHDRPNNGETHVADNERTIRERLVPAFGHVRLRDLRRQHLQTLKLELQKEGKTRYGAPLKPRSINACLGLAKAVLEKAVEWEMLAANPFKKVKLISLQQNEADFDYWTAAERDLFLERAYELDAEFTDAAEVACFTGLRQGEQAALKRRRDVDLGLKLINVFKVYSYKTGKDRTRTKNGKAEVIPMNVRAEAALSRALLRAADGGLVFPVELLRNANKRLRRLCREVGVREIGWHDLRHTFASTLVMATVPLYTVQRLMRHKSIKMTERYAHLAPSYLAEASEALTRVIDTPVPPAPLPPAPPPVNVVRLEPVGRDRAQRTVAAVAGPDLAPILLFRRRTGDLST